MTTPDDPSTDGSLPDNGAADELDLPADGLLVLPIRNTVLFPGLVLPLTIARPGSIAAAQQAVRAGSPLGVILQSDPTAETPGEAELHRVGTVCDVLRYLTAPDGSHHLVVRGQERFRVLEWLGSEPMLRARVERKPDAEIDSPELEARVMQLKARARQVIELLPETPAEIRSTIDSLEPPTALADFIAGIVGFKPAEMQTVLECFDPNERFDRVLELVNARFEVLELSRRIGERTQETFDARQREQILREQLRQIRVELGEEDGGGAEIAELRERIDASSMPDEPREAALKELRRLERTPEAAMEHGMIRSYLDWLTELPWSGSSDASRIDLVQARRILDEDHHGLDKIKKRILEYLAVVRLNPSGQGPILCFVGPPGVGKTSLGRSIARAIGRQFVRISLGGVHDESEIRGHRRTYVGALPGNIVQSLRKAGSNDPVFLLDEIDKLGAGFHGDPASALLEVLDPEQNSTFRDTYLGVPYDLSHVMFIATANVLDAIPAPLRDRMEVIELPGYTLQEKLEIAKRHLVARQRRRAGLDEAQCLVDDDALRAVITGYTREAGCRGLEREIAALCRQIAVRVAEGDDGPHRIGADDVATMLGPRRHENESALRTAVTGVATGLAWTPVGGELLFVEASKVPGTGQLILTGQLGDVMKESAQAATTLVRGQADTFDADASSLGKFDLHVHVPAGAIPKDGPSAGVAIYVALVSLLSGRRVRADVAMTGEVSLRGLVLPVGGIKEKVLAAERAGIATVLLPARNRRDLEDVPPAVRERLHFVWLDDVASALTEALLPGTDDRRARDTDRRDEDPSTPVADRTPVGA